MPPVVPFIPAIAAGITAAGGIATAAMSNSGSKQQTPVFNAEAEKKKAAMQTAEANKKRALSETNTVRTSALGNTGSTQTQKKTILGG